MGRSIAIAIFISACASGGVNGGDKIDAAVASHEDAHFIVEDAPKHSDARPLDAFVPQDAPPDASGVGDGGICSANSQCIVAGECCVTLGGPAGFCAPGTVALGQCVPN
jgi:hypothetical protein